MKAHEAEIKAPISEAIGSLQTAPRLESLLSKRAVRTRDHDGYALLNQGKRRVGDNMGYLASFANICMDRRHAQTSIRASMRQRT